MATKATIELDPNQQEILQQQLNTGRYRDVGEVIDDALRLVSERDALLDEWLRGEVTAALADKRPSVPMADVFKRLEARHGRRMKAAKRGA